MATASYDFEGMRQQASRVKKGADDLSSLISTIDSVVSEMASAWNDPAQKKFEQQWSEMSTKLKEYVPVIVPHILCRIVQLFKLCVHSQHKRREYCFHLTFKFSLPLFCPGHLIIRS